MYDPSHKSFISNFMNNHAFTTDNIFILFLASKISSTYGTRKPLHCLHSSYKHTIRLDMDQIDMTGLSNQNEFSTI